ncbi:MAG: response regulator transcription factor [Cyclobacteriaceae bacterium]|jgi:DNA-binding NarL/FixJ family response regulator|nr:response regulator transcription factor [Cyclobacteriaceae bacterium]
MERILVIERNALDASRILLTLQANRTTKGVYVYPSITESVGSFKKIMPSLLLLGESAEAYNLISLLTIKKIHPLCKTLALLGGEDEREWKFFLQAGVNGLLAKSATPSEWNNCLQALSQTGTYLPTLINTQLRQEMELSSLATLTPKEYAVLAELSKGLSYLQICRNLNITRGTLTSHIFKLYGKLGVHNRYEAVLKAGNQAILPMAGFSRMVPSLSANPT